MAATAREERRCELRPIGQDAQDAVGACTTVCTFIAFTFCALPSCIEVPDVDMISNRVITACIQWKGMECQQNASPGGWQSIPQALRNNFLLRMALVEGPDRCLAPDGPRPRWFDVEEELERPSFLDARGHYPHTCKVPFRQPVCALMCDGTFTYMVCKRFLPSSRQLNYWFFDPHGQRSTLVGFESAKACAAYLLKHTGIGDRKSRRVVDWWWVLCAILPPTCFAALDQEHRQARDAVAAAASSSSSSSSKRRRKKPR